jgi:hypothetical protein
LRELADDDRAGRIGELGQLAEVIVDGATRAGALERSADEQRSLRRRRNYDWLATYVRILVIERLACDTCCREAAVG